MPWRISLFLLLLTATGFAADKWPEPAARFQQVYSKIITGAPPTSWRTELETIAQIPGTNTLTKSVPELARVWLARLQLPELDAALRRYYRFNARFPTTLDSIEPPSLRFDPWGDPWDYRLTSPKGLKRLIAQRYQVAPKRYPKLTSLDQAIKAGIPSNPPWKITFREIGNRKSLEIGTALIQPGASLEGYTLIFIGDHFALWAGHDHLFAVNF